MDAITVQILRNKVASLVDEMHYHFYRSGYSSIIRESRDFSCVILDREGRLIVAPPMFFHAPVYRHLVGRIRALYDGGENGAIHDGDVFVSNHPYEGGLPHVSDMAFVAPVFAGGEIVAFAGSIAHKADVGGTVPGSTSANATEMYQEGLLLPPLKIHAAGQALPDVERLILANSRQPELVRGDVRAQIAITKMGAARVAELCERFGSDTLTTAFAAILKGAADELRAALAALPAGTASAEGLFDSDGIDIDKPVRLAVTITVEDGSAHFDFSDSGPQARGPINLRPPMVEACVFYSLLGSLGPHLHFNDGMRDVLTFTYAPRTVTNSEAPAPVSNYQMTNLKLVDVIIEALAHFNPGRAAANAGSSSALGILWSRGRQGQSNLQYEIMGSAYGGGMGHDGASATATHLSNLHITPIEILESENPCRIRRFELVADSGGAGQWRGGLSYQREYELLEDAVVIRRFDRARHAPNGLNGGAAGSRSRFVLRPGTDAQHEATQSGRFELKAGDRFVLQSAGGGGFGDPARRSPAAVAADVAEGYVSATAAREQYGQSLSSSFDNARNP
ncbi:hydantoinase B/oxoprolinase family protein [Pigmentiphaga sp. H8]|uniref:hydantoinase B/oxoprolinase family protein n=1 Tax=Pigmentiphaga sp. H8 TaxID=2488560 RepID=UPI000F5A1EAF|nr:hydantoinase B/oxoprolinase family protein [Pigmentiphaga sp. H8]AZG09747.1 hydantoinase B/oxoprolinase family protein [Pigmentiphaga sp. H8]